MRESDVVLFCRTFSCFGLLQGFVTFRAKRKTLCGIKSFSFTLELSEMFVGLFVMTFERCS